MGFFFGGVGLGFFVGFFLLAFFGGGVLFWVFWFCWGFFVGVFCLVLGVFGFGFCFFWLNVCFMDCMHGFTHRKFEEILLR